ADPTLRGRLDVTMHTGTGAASCAVISFEHEPGEHHGRHMLVLEGEAEVVEGDERGRVSAGAVALIAATVPHDVANVGPGRLRVIGFFSSAAVVSVFDEALLPFGTRALTLGAPEADPS
ncbi:MAG TPA: cupin domain-containing protein, partial [Miltoncostaeaceae bacterium]|nr:cupin domain-containing protein [Miltoncostaeaceae bacterium]